MPQELPARSVRRFRRLLRLLPFDFRRNYGEDMAGVFEDHHDAAQHDGRSAVRKMWMRTARGMLQLAGREHWAAWRQDVRYALRMLWRSPGFTLAAILSLALGIGANAAVFGIAEAVLVNPLPIPDPDRAVSVFVIDQQNPGYTPVSTDNFRDVRDQAATLAEVGAFFFVAARSQLAEHPEQVNGFVVSGGYFPALGIDARAGRLLGHDDDRTPGGHPVVVLSHAFWMRLFNGSTTAIGRTLTLNDRPYTVVGITPESFGGTFGLFQPDVYLPLTMYETLSPGTAWAEGRRWRWLNIVGRLAPGVSMGQAEAELRAIGDRLAVEYPEVNEHRSLTVLPLARSVINANQYDAFTRAWWVLGAIVAALLLIACTNIANLLLARNTARAREIAVRLSIGASRFRVVRQLMTESLLLAVIGGGVALGLVHGLFIWLWHARPQSLQQLIVRPDVDMTAVVFTFLVAGVTAVLFGLVPALQVLRTDLSRTLADGGRTPTAAVRPRLRAALVATQVALATVALVVAGLFAGSLAQARQVDPGFRHDGLFTVNYSVERPDANAALERYGRLLDEVRAMPSVRAAAVADRLPLTPGNANTIERVFGSDVAEQVERTLVQVAEVSPGYFETVGIALEKGRTFDARDRLGAPPVAIVNRTMAERFWPGRQALGQRFASIIDDEPLEVVGVVADSKYTSLGEESQPFFYRAFWQNPTAGAGPRWILVSAPEGAGQLAASLTDVLRTFDPDMPINDIGMAGQRLDQALFAPRMLATIMAGFGAIALALACAGIYGLLAVTVGQRVHEFGLRMTLGATPTDLVRLVVGRGMRWVLAGAAIGVAGAVAAMRLTRSLLFAPDDLASVALAGALGLLMVVALVACLVPALRAARVDPAAALRA